MKITDVEIIKRTFEAKKYPKGSEKRAKTYYDFMEGKEIL